MMQAYAPLGEKKNTIRVSSRALTMMLLANAALICVFLFATSGAGNVGAAPAIRTRAFSPSIVATRVPGMRVNAAVTDFDSFKREMDSKYPDQWSMKADSMYADVKTQFEQKKQFVTSEEERMSNAMLDISALENEPATVERGLGTFLAPALLAGLPLVTIVGLVTGAISTVQVE
eukprot:CAMPEP_0184478608 /NCGR_PEP_ID=MMETSP0113_2-20130426/586_1 /TAXON_ID=91329 /ORGANISM="Norrisiella sphaerica, Strain BC52" /LENGTH=174 /DNA_ID=CAMNT_0026856463 /DNA_START=71 /DNA_END=595 /DNA_ORIENTATION=-